MDESKRNLYRLDPVKLQQKIYDLYPTNSAVRKAMIADVKRDQLSYYSKLLQDMPVQVAEESLVQNRRTMLKLSASAGAFLLLSVVGFLASFVTTLTTLETVLLSIVAGGFLAISVVQFKLVFHLKTVSDNFTKAVSGIKTKMNELRKGL